MRLHFEDGFYERYQEEKKAGNSKDKSESNSYPRLLRYASWIYDIYLSQEVSLMLLCSKVTTLVESTTSLSAEETKSFFCQNNAEAYKVTGRLTTADKGFCVLFVETAEGSRIVRISRKSDGKLGMSFVTCESPFEGRRIQSLSEDCQGNSGTPWHL